ncbi:MAG: hypothetical protein FJ202_10770 [Gemmatimonadetes bacterium]|nr:hypothetical protein [Gemmatimonadota bacterium]
MRLARRAFSVVVLISAAAAAEAQDAVPAGNSPSPSRAVLIAPAQHDSAGSRSPNVRSGPMTSAATVGIVRKAPAPAPLAPKQLDTPQNRAMMIVGGAAFIAGAIIRDTPGQIVMIGGAGLGLWGLYQYLQ